MAALTEFKCQTCGLVVRARAAIEVAHPCPLRRTKAGQPRMTTMDKNEDE